MRSLRPAARLYLLHVILLTAGLSINTLFFNLAIPTLGFDLSFLGLLNSLPVLVGALLSLPLWALVLRIGLRNALLISACGNAAATLTVALWPDYLPLLLTAALGGPAGVVFQLSAAPFMMRHSSETERDTLFSLNAGLGLGVAGVGSLLGGALPGLAARLFDLALQSGPAYRATFGVAGLLVLLSVLPLLLIRGDQSSGDAQVRDETTALSLGPRPIANRVPAALAMFLRNPWPILHFMPAPLFISCGAALLIPYLNRYFRLRFGVADEVLGVIFAAMGIATGLATLAAPRLSARIGKMPSVVLTQGLAIPCLLALGAAPLLWLAVGVAVLRQTLMNMAAPLYEAYAMEASDPAQRSLVMGLLGGAFAAGYTIAPNISVMVQERYGFAPLFYATAACYTLAALCNYVLFVRKVGVEEKVSSL